jgi:chaperone BCS1
MKRGFVVVPTAWLFLNPLGHLASSDDVVRLSGPGGHMAQQVSGEVRLGLLRALGARESQNMLATAGALVLVGATVAVATWVYDWAWNALARKITTRVEFDSRDDSFRWVMEWLLDNKYAQKHAGVYVCAASPTKVYGFSGRVKDEPDTPQLTPGEGMHWLTTSDGSWVFLRRTSKGARGNARQETLTCLMIGGRAKVDRFIAECATACRQKDLMRTLVYSGGEHGSWNMAQARVRRPIHTVILDSKHLALVTDAREFLGSETWYAERGIPWRRGFLLHGPPGTGKSSFVTALAGELGINIYCIQLGSAGMTDEALQSLVLTVPKLSVLLMEDIDAAFTNSLEEEPAAPQSSDKPGKGGRRTKLSMSGLMNAIDGVVAQQGCLLFMTTNNIAMLPERLIRSGRIDVRCEFGLASTHQIAGLFRLFYGSERPEEAEFVSLCPENTFSCSDVQSFFTSNKFSPAEAIEALKLKLSEK